jgi:multidrug efflux pump
MFSRFFIEHPIGASMLSLAIVLLGVFLFLKLPIASYPEITPPTIQVSTSYPGASARVVAETVAAPIEQEVNGVEDMLYMSSKSTNDGRMNLDVTFNLGADLDMAQVLVQNRVAIAQAKLPEETRRQGVVTKKKSPNILLIVNLISPDGSRDMLYLNNYVIIRIKDVLARIKGVGDAQVLGARDYSMRVWLDPRKLAEKDLMASDVIAAIREQNVQVAAGRLGQPPTPAGQAFQLAINTQGRLLTPEQFEKIVVKTGEDGRLVYLRDVVRDDRTRVRLDPDKLQKNGLKVSDIVRVLREQNIQFPPKRPGLPPHVPTDGELEFEVKARPELLRNIVVKREGPGQALFLTDLVRKEGGLRELDRGVELGAKSYDVSTYLDGKPSVGLAIYQQPGANAVETARIVREEMKRLKQKFPPGVDYAIVYDTTTFIDESIQGVYETLFEALALVFLVVLIFLQNWRTTVIPMIAVPVSLVGTFAVMAALGFSLNNLSLFGLVLAIGVTVDDAIVVVENVERNMAQGLGAKEASIKAMGEITGACIATTLVLCAVFIPTALIAGITGQFYRQFALTIAAATVISTFNALTLSPALCALLLKPPSEGKQEALPCVGIVILGGLAALLLAPRVAGLIGIETADNRWALWGLRAGCFAVGAVAGWLLAGVINGLLGTFFGGFNWVFDRVRGAYGVAVKWCLRLAMIVLLVYAGLIGLTWLGFNVVPTGFIPPQDKGYVLVNAQLPEAASLDRTEEVVDRLDRIARDMPGVAHTIGVPGYSLLTSSNISNVGGMFVVLEGFDRRKGHPELSSDAILAELRKRFYGVQAAQVVGFGPPPVDGLGTTGGFKMQVEDQGSLGLEALQGAVARMVEKGNEQTELTGLFSSFRADQPQVYVEIDRVQAKRMGIKLDDVFATLQANLGSAYVNDFTLSGRNWQVNVQADSRYRLEEKDIGQLQVRNAKGKMVPLSALITIKDVTGPAIVNRYNLFPSAEITGNPAPGYSSGQAITLMQEIAKEELPQSMGYEWTELTLQQIKAGEDWLNLLVFPLGVVFMFMVLAFQYESLSLPLAIMLIVPMCLLSAIVGVGLCGMDNNIFTQIGFVVLAALAAKNAILIVEFAKERQNAGLSRFDATLEACRLRLRPILMTAFSTLLGAVPLVVATGAGAEMRVALGVAFFSGMLGVTLFGLFFTPVFYLVIRWLVERRGSRPGPEVALDLPVPAPPPAETPSTGITGTPGPDGEVSERKVE